MNRQLATGPAESALLTDLERHEIPVFSLKKHRDALGSRDKRTFHALAQELQRKGWFLPIERSSFVVVPRAARGTWNEHPFIIAAALSPEPYYISYWSALSFHNLTTQMPRSVAIVITGGRSRRKPVLTFQGYRYQFVTRSPATFFSSDEHILMGLNGAAHVSVEVARPEKAILDCLDDERLAGGMPEIIAAVRRGLDNKGLDLQRLLDDASRYPNKAVSNRLGYILGHFNVDSAVVNALRTRVRRTGYPPYLSSLASRQNAHRDPSWNLMVNLSASVFEDVG